MRILVAAQRQYPMPDDEIYFPVQAGALGRQSIGYARDDSGENISEKNCGYSEMTVLYWAWKNLDDDILGLAHYRRHFKGKGASLINPAGRRISLLSGDELKATMEHFDIIVPMPRRYYIETLFGHYSHTFDGQHLEEARRLLLNKEPELSDIVDDVYSRTYGYMFNMLIVRRDLLNDYCEWIFPILFELENVISVDGMSAFEARLFGRISEILFNVWVEKKRQEGFKIKEIPVVATEPINWFKKGYAFLAAKFAGKKYKQSF